MKLFLRYLLMLSLVLGSAFSADVPQGPEKMAEFYLRQMIQFEFSGMIERTHLGDAQRYKDLFLQAAQLVVQADKKEYFEYFAPWANSPEAIEKMPPREVYGSLFKGLMEASKKMSPDEHEELVQQTKASTVEVIGHTMDGPETMLINYRISGIVNGKPSSLVKVIRLKKDGETWMFAIDEANFTKINQTIDQLQKIIARKAEADTPTAQPK